MILDDKIEAILAKADKSELNALQGDLTGVNNTLSEHISNKDNPHEVTKEQLGLGNVNNTSDLDKPISTATQNALNKLAESINTGGSHSSDKNNPHEVTASQIGLGNVPNVTTNDQTPTYTEATNTTALVSGEKLSTAFGKISKAISSLISHIANLSNPHNVTKSQLGLENVDNTSDVDKPISTATQTALDLKAKSIELISSIENYDSKINELNIENTFISPVSRLISTLTFVLESKFFLYASSAFFCAFQSS